MQHPNSSSDASYFGYHDMGIGMGSGSSAPTFPDSSATLPWTIGPNPFGGLFNNTRMMPFGYDDEGSMVSECLGHGTARFGLHTELQKPTAQEIMDAKALAASKNHSQAERRRRERINNHLAKLRSLLPNTSKTDKASLLAEVIQHMKDLKQETSSTAVSETLPTETDELTVEEYASSLSDGWMIRASICCEDRSDLLSDLTSTLKGLRLRTVKAEITTLGGRVKNVLFVTGDGCNDQQHCLSSIEEALRSVMEKVDEESVGHVKRHWTTNAI